MTGRRLGLGGWFVTLEQLFFERIEVDVVLVLLGVSRRVFVGRGRRLSTPFEQLLFEGVEVDVVLVSLNAAGFPAVRWLLVFRPGLFRLLFLCPKKIQ